MKKDRKLTGDDYYMVRLQDLMLYSDFDPEVRVKVHALMKLTTQQIKQINLNPTNAKEGTTNV